MSSLQRRRERAIADFARRLRAALGQRLVDLRLFGSVARGDATPESDIDVLVVVDAETDRWRLAGRVSDIAFDINLAHAVFVSPVVVSAADARNPIWRETPFLRSAYSEGVPL